LVSIHLSFIQPISNCTTVTGDTSDRLQKQAQETPDSPSSYFTGKEVVLKIDIPGSQQGVEPALQHIPSRHIALEKIFKGTERNATEMDLISRSTLSALQSKSSKYQDDPN
jgi:hypothetical protein